MSSAKGTVPFLAGDERYLLLLDFNALCDLESELPGLMDGTAEIKSPSAIRAVFHAGLVAHHGDVDLRDAGKIIHEIGIEQAAELVKEAFEASFGKTDGGEGKSRPRKRGAGTAP